MTLRDQLVTPARCHRWATRRLLEAQVAKLPEDDYRRDCGLFFRSIHGTHHRGRIGTALTAIGQASPLPGLVSMLQQEAAAR